MKKKKIKENSNYRVSLAELAAEMIAYLFICSSCLHAVTPFDTNWFLLLMQS